MNCLINKTLSDVDSAVSARQAEDKLRAAFNKHLGLLIVLKNDMVDWPFVKGLLSSREFPKQASVCYVQALRDRFADIVAAIHKLQVLGAEVSEELRATTQVVNEGPRNLIRADPNNCRSTPIMTPAQSFCSSSPPRSHLSVALAKGCQTEWSLMKVVTVSAALEPPVLYSPEASPAIMPKGLLSQTEDLLISPLKTPMDAASDYASPLDDTLVERCPPTRAHVGGDESQILTIQNTHNRASQTRRSLIEALNSTLRESFGDFLRGGSTTKRITQQTSSSAREKESSEPNALPSEYIDEFPITEDADVHMSCWQKDLRLSDGGPAAKRRKYAQDFAAFLDESAFMNCLNFAKYPSKMLKLICDELGLKNTTKKETVKQLELIRDAIRMRYFENADEPFP